MARPLNKKYFGNRNIGTGGDQTTGNLSNSQNYSDDRIGGEGVASYTVDDAGTGWTTAPTVTFSAPVLPGGVTTAGTAHYKALSFATTANGTGYDVGNVLEVFTGTASTKARAPVESITAVSVTLVNAGDNYNDGDTLEFRTGQDTYVTIRVNTGVDTTDRPAESLTIVSGGTRSTAKPTGTLSYQNTLGGTGITFTLEWGAYSFGAPSVAGDYTVFPSTGASGTLTSISPATGTGAKADITMGLLSIAVTEKGSGYVDVADADVAFSGSTGADVTAVLTTDSSDAPYAAGNQENAIVIYANTSGSGSTGKAGDIIKQTNARSYKVKTADGTAVVTLGTDATPADGQAYIVATDNNDNTYFVTKLTAHRATLTQWENSESDWLFETGDSTGWTFGSTSADTVRIENA